VNTVTCARKEITNTRDEIISVTEGKYVKYDNTRNIQNKMQTFNARRTVIVQLIYAFSWVVVVVATVALKAERQASQHPKIV
jgi:hypothetical protein